MRVLFAFLTMLAILDFPATVRAEDSLNALLDPIRTKYQLPAIAAAVMKDGKLVADGAVGVRVAGQDIPVTIDDPFHLGSDTKAMTATLAGMMVEEGKLRWDSTIQEVLGPILPGLRPKFGAITLRELLSHTSGLPADNEEIGRLYFNPDAADHPLTDWRLRMISNWGSKHDPTFANAGKFQYANLGYIIAGAMIEKASGKPWERLMFERIFVPLELKSAGLGAQATFGEYDAPVGHRIDDKGKVTPFPWGESADLPGSLGPAGLAHMSIKDFATWAAWNAGEGKRGPALVKPETLKIIHKPVIDMQIKDPKPGTPKTGSYALGWGLSKFDWSDKPLLTHNGSNGMNFASILLDVDHDLAIVVTTNIAGPHADPATLDVMKALYAKYAQ
ncbi:serine hydrolase [Hyphomicrobium sp. 99]|uniref:serine hydrolase domain-containing protein n=1 Tax=Hyphomicrobium sp. 99 TaxID=1163419 RepID=UPI0005F78F7B|nr:serine hydrolase domain-containing protein [Hyphomicrobium sp. 99]